MAHTQTYHNSAETSTFYTFQQQHSERYRAARRFAREVKQIVRKDKVGQCQQRNVYLLSERSAGHLLAASVRYYGIEKMQRGDYGMMIKESIKRHVDHVVTVKVEEGQLRIRDASHLLFDAGRNTFFDDIESLLDHDSLKWYKTVDFKQHRNERDHARKLAAGKIMKKNNISNTTKRIAHATCSRLRVGESMPMRSKPNLNAPQRFVEVDGVDVALRVRKISDSECVVYGVARDGSEIDIETVALSRNS